MSLQRNLWRGLNTWNGSQSNAHPTSATCFFWRRDGGRVGGCLKKLFTKDWNLMEQSGNGCMTLPQRMWGKTRYILLMQMDNQATKWTLGSDSGLFLKRTGYIICATSCFALFQVWRIFVAKGIRSIQNDYKARLETGLKLYGFVVSWSCEPWTWHLGRMYQHLWSKARRMSALNQHRHPFEISITQK